MIVRTRFLEPEHFLLKSKNAAALEIIVKKYGYKFLWMGRDTRADRIVVYVDRRVFQAIELSSSIIKFAEEITLQEILSRIEII